MKIWLEIVGDVRKSIKAINNTITELQNERYNETKEKSIEMGFQS